MSGRGIVVGVVQQHRRECADGGEVVAGEQGGEFGGDRQAGTVGTRVRWR